MKTCDCNVMFDSLVLAQMFLQDLENKYPKAKWGGSDQKPTEYRGWVYTFCDCVSFQLEFYPDDSIDITYCDSSDQIKDILEEKMGPSYPVFFMRVNKPPKRS